MNTTPRFTRPLAAVCCLALAACLAAPAQAASPTLSNIMPRGGQRGPELEVVFIG